MNPTQQVQFSTDSRFIRPPLKKTTTYYNINTLKKKTRISITDAKIEKTFEKVHGIETQTQNSNILN